MKKLFFGCWRFDYWWEVGYAKQFEHDDDNNASYKRRYPQISETKTRSKLICINVKAGCLEARIYPIVLLQEGEDELKKKQLMELAIINGTYRDYSALPGKF